MHEAPRRPRLRSWRRSASSISSTTSRPSRRHVEFDPARSS